MTITLPDQDTDAARQILERAEIEPPCDHPSCDRPAEWILRFTSRPCDCVITFLSCGPCLDRAWRSHEDTALSFWRCCQCGKGFGPCMKREAQELDVEPLR